MTKQQSQPQRLQLLQLPDDRLRTAASLVQPGGVTADVGTDHGYIPIWLLQEGICPLAVASDIHKGPLEKARENGIRYGVSDRLRLYLCDGLDGIEPEKNGVTDICICGMGGELIAAIVERCSYVRENHTNLILQPMSSGYELRKALGQKGFCIRQERLCQAAGRVYTCMQVTYTGEVQNRTEAELYIGRHTDTADPLYALWLERHRKALEKQIHGREMGGLDTTWEKAVLAALESMA